LATITNNIYTVESITEMEGTGVSLGQMLNRTVDNYMKYLILFA